MEIEKIHLMTSHRKPRSHSVQMPRSGPPLFIPFLTTSRKDPSLTSSYKRRCLHGNVPHCTSNPSSTTVRKRVQRRPEKQSGKPKSGFKQGTKIIAISNNDEYVSCKESHRKDLFLDSFNYVYDQCCNSKHNEPKRKGKIKEEHQKFWDGGKGLSSIINTKRKLGDKDVLFNCKKTNFCARKASLRHSLGAARRQRLALHGDAPEEEGLDSSTSYTVKRIVWGTQSEEKYMLETTKTNVVENTQLQADQENARVAKQCKFDADDDDTEGASEFGKSRENKCENDDQHVGMEKNQTNDGQDQVDMADSVQKNLPTNAFEIIEFKVGVSQAEQAIKKEMAAKRRKQEIERNAKQTQANAVQKILGQESSRKRREVHLVKLRQEKEKEKQAALEAPPVNSIRWIMGPSGNVVSFSKDVEKSRFFPTPCSYPQEREKCAGPFCNNVYKYRDSKTQVPLCSLQCYKAVQELKKQMPHVHQ